MKLLFINYQALPLPSVKGGAVEYLVDEFLKYNEVHKLHNITVCSIYDENALLESKSYNRTEFKYIKIESIWDKLNRGIRHIINKHTPFYIGNTYIKKILKDEKDFNKYDAIIIENAPEFGLKIRKVFKKRLILHLHNDYLNKNSGNAEKIFDCYDEIYTISNTLGNIVKEIKQSDKIKTLYNGIRLENFRENGKRDEMRNKYKIGKDDFVFMYSGRITRDKGVYELAKAFSEIKNEKLKLVIAGKGTNQTVEAIKNINDKRIIFTGFVPYSQMNDIYQVADVGVIPSICQDAFNLTVIEYASNGIPLIISNRGAMKELINEKCSVIAEYDKNFFSDNIRRALELMLVKDIDKMSEEAKKISENFTIENFCNTFKKLLDKEI
ncbi:MAG: glycosyltransferase family 4 protein [Ruminococcaceae bacterium]|nr:glycosyltransferase family 4 protein [Oscillospiraceae bacterium]